MRKVLVVEDEPVLRSALARGLARVADVRVAASLDEARGLSTGVDCVIADRHLPDGDSLGWLEELSRAGTPTLLHTSHPPVELPAHLGLAMKPANLGALRAWVAGGA